MNSVKRKRRVAVTPAHAAQLIDRFLAKYITRATLRAYRQDLNAYAQSARIDQAAEALAALLSLDEKAAVEKVEAYKKSLAGQPELTFRRRISTLRGFCRYAKDAGVIPWKLDVSLWVGRTSAQSNQARKKDMSGPSEATVHRLRRQLAEAGQRKDLRDLALVELFHFRGLRVGEALGLDVADVSFERKTVIVLGKGDATEELEVTDVVLGSIRRWLAVRPGPKDGPLFVGLSRRSRGAPKRLSEIDVLQMLKARGRQIGAETVLRPHGLRHTSITTAINHSIPAGMNIMDVQRFARHKSIASTVGYLNNNVGSVRSVMKSVPTHGCIRFCT